MLRGAALTLSLIVAIPLCVLVGAILGYHLLLLLYLVFGIDFPTEASILVGLSPIIISIVVVSRFLARRFRYSRRFKY